MSTTAKRINVIDFAGDVIATEQYAAADNEGSPGVIDLINLVIGFNQVSIKSGAHAVTIIPPTTNAVSITLKGLTGDTGIRIHNTDPTTVAFDSSVATIGLTAGAALNGVRLVWT